MTTLNLAVTADADDITCNAWDGGLGAVNDLATLQSWAGLGGNPIQGASWDWCCRFLNVFISNASNITAATHSVHWPGFYQDGSNDGSCAMLLEADAPAINSGASEAVHPYYRWRDGGTISNPVWFIDAAIIGDAYNTSTDFAAAVQEVVDLPGWVTGNAMAFYMASNRFGNATNNANSHNNGFPPFLDIDGDFAAAIGIVGTPTAQQGTHTGTMTLTSFAELDADGVLIADPATFSGTAEQIIGALALLAAQNATLVGLANYVSFTNPASVLAAQSATFVGVAGSARTTTGVLIAEPATFIGFATTVHTSGAVSLTADAAQIVAAIAGLTQDASGILVADSAALTGQATSIHSADDQAGIPGLGTQPATLVGDATGAEVTAGFLQAQAASTPASTAQTTHISFGDLISDVAELAGTATVIRQASGILIADPATFDGDATSGVEAAFGTLAAQEATTTQPSTAFVVHDFTGVLLAQLAGVQGQAQVLGVEDSSGDLQAQAATLFGTAFSKVPFPARGDLIADFAVIDGQAISIHFALGTIQGQSTGLSAQQAGMSRSYAAVVGDIIGWCFVNQQVYIPGAEEQQAFFPGMEEEQVCV